MRLTDDRPLGVALRQTLDSALLLRGACYAAMLWTIVFWRLGYASLLDPDEAHYAEITKEMLLAGRWLVPTIGDVPFIDKPILFHWVQGLSFAALGISEFAARLPSALAAIALVWTTYWAGRELFDRQTGELAAGMLITMPATFALSSLAVLDMVFTALLFGAVACLAVAIKKPSRRIEWIGYALLSLAIQVKGPVALLLLALSFVAALGLSSWRPRILELRWVMGPAAAAACAAPWFVWMWHRFGSEFLRHYLLEGHVWYLTTLSHSASRNHFFYVNTLASAFLPWSPLVACRAAGLVSSSSQRKSLDASEGVLWIWSIVVVGLFSTAAFKLDQYIYPAAPAFALVAARAWVRAADRSSGRNWERAGALMIPAVLAGAGIAIAWALWRLDLGAPRSAGALPVVLLSGAAWSACQFYGRRGYAPTRPAAVVLTMTVALGSVVLFGFPVLERARPAPAVARWIASQRPTTGELGVYRLERWEASLRFYSGHRIRRLNSPHELVAFLDDRHNQFAVMLRKDYQLLRQSGVPLGIAFERPAIVSTKGTGLRRQLWGGLVAVTAGAPTTP